MFRRLLTLIALFGSLALPARAQDAFDLHQAIIHSSPADIADWPIGGSITHIDVQPGQSGGFNVASPVLQNWPDFTPAGWDGPIQYTTWACVNLEGWHCAGFIQEWRGRGFTGAGWLEDSNYNKNWAYDANRWGPMVDYVPKTGDTIGIFLSAGNARGVGGVTSVRSRTNVVTFRLPTGDAGSLDFASTLVPTPTPTPQPVPTPTPTPTPSPLPAPMPTVDLTPILNAIGNVSVQLQALSVKVDTSTEAIVAAVNEPAWYTKLAENKYVQMIITAVGTYVATKKIGG